MCQGMCYTYDSDCCDMTCDRACGRHTYDSDCCDMTHDRHCAYTVQGKLEYVSSLFS